MSDKEIKAEIKGLYDKIDLCIGELVKGRVTHNETLVANAQHKMESLMVQALQVLSCISDAIEEPVSEDLDEEIEKYLDHNYYIDEEGIVCDRSHPRLEYCEDKFKKDARHFANWQKQKTIDKACKWLKENAANYVYWMDEEFGGEDLIDDFKKYMEDEK